MSKLDHRPWKELSEYRLSVSDRQRMKSLLDVKKHEREAMRYQVRSLSKQIIFLEKKLK